MGEPVLTKDQPPSFRECQSAESLRSERAVRMPARIEVCNLAVRLAHRLSRELHDVFPSSLEIDLVKPATVLFDHAPSVMRRLLLDIGNPSNRPRRAKPGTPHFHEPPLTLQAH